MDGVQIFCKQCLRRKGNVSMCLNNFSRQRLCTLPSSQSQLVALTVKPFEMPCKFSVPHLTPCGRASCSRQRQTCPSSTAPTHYGLLPSQRLGFPQWRLPCSRPLALPGPPPGPRQHALRQSPRRRCAWHPARLAVLAEPPWWPASQWQVLLWGAGCASLTQATANHAPQRSNRARQCVNWRSSSWQLSTSRRLGHIFVRWSHLKPSSLPPCAG